MRIRRSYWSVNISSRNTVIQSTCRQVFVSSHPMPSGSSWDQPPLACPGRFFHDIPFPHPLAVFLLPRLWSAGRQRPSGHGLVGQPRPKGGEATSRYLNQKQPARFATPCGLTAASPRLDAFETHRVCGSVPASSGATNCTSFLSSGRRVQRSPSTTGQCLIASGSFARSAGSGGGSHGLPLRQHAQNPLRNPCISGTRAGMSFEGTELKCQCSLWIR